MTKSTSNSPPQGLNWTAPESETADDLAASEKQEESNDIKGLFDRNQKTSVTPLPVGANISLPPVPEQDVSVKLVVGEKNSPPEGESDALYSPPPVAAFGGNKDARSDRKAPTEDSSAESARGLFSMDADSDSKEGEVSQADSIAVQPKAAPRRSKSKKTVVGIGPGQPPMPPIPPAAKDVERAKEVAVPDSATPLEQESNRAREPEGAKPGAPKASAIEEKASQTNEPERTKPVAPEALADTLFSGISTIPSVPSKPNAMSQSKGKSVENRSTESPSSEPAIPPSVDATSSIRTPPKGYPIKTVALWSGAGLLLVGGIVVAVTVGLNRFASKQSTITVVQERIDRTDKESIAAQSRERSIKKVATIPEGEKPEIERVQLKQTAQPIEPPEQGATQDQNADPIEPPKEPREPESVRAGTEQETEPTFNVREMLQRGKRQLRKGDRDHAEASFRAVLEQDPDEHHAMEGLVEILIKRGQASEALPYCEHMVKKRSRRARYRILYGDALAMVGNKKAAKQQYSEALRYSPNNEKAKRRLAKLQ